MSKRDVSNNRYKKSYQTKGGESKGFLDTRDLDVSYFKPEARKMYQIMIIPYIVGSDNHPDMKKGDLDYLLDVYTHRRIGVQETDVICPKYTYGKPCPICEEADNLKEANNEKEYAKIKASRRVVYNIIDNDILKIFSTSHWLFEKELIETAMGYDEEEQLVSFASIDNGKLIQFRVVQGSGDWVEFKAFQFKDRPEKYTTDYVDKLVDKAIPLDKLIKVYSYNELKAILYGEPMEDSEEVSKENSGESEREKRRRERQEKTQETKEEKTGNKCPAGLRFGEDLDSDPACDNKENGKCPVYAECEKEFERTHG